MLELPNYWALLLRSEGLAPSIDVSPADVSSPIMPAPREEYPKGSMHLSTNTF